MEYYKTDDGQIQANYAERLRIVLKQYHEQIIGPDKYEVSLSLAILQTLLTNCMELLKHLNIKGNNPITEYPINSEIWGFGDSCVVRNTFKQAHLNAYIIFRHLRNSLSHPTKLDLNSPLKSTGYTSTGNSTTIETLTFVTSPDINENGNLNLYTEHKANSIINNSGEIPPNVQVVEVNRKFRFQLNGDPFYRICEIVLDPKSILNMCNSLASFLAYPLNSNWDGKTFNISKLAA